MTKKKKETTDTEVVEVVKETEEVLVLRATRPLNGTEFNLMSDMVQKEQKKTGVKIVLIPNSSELVEDEE